MLRISSIAFKRAVQARPALVAAYHRPVGSAPYVPPIAKEQQDSVTLKHEMPVDLPVDLASENLTFAIVRLGGTQYKVSRFYCALIAFR